MNSRRRKSFTAFSILIGLSTLASISIAAGPTTQPTVRLADIPAVPQASPPLTVAGRPAFVAKFAKVNTVPGGRFAERQYAYQYTYPGPAIYGCYGGYAFGGYCGGWGFGGASWGSTEVNWH